MGRPHPLKAAIGKRSLALTLDPQPLRGAAATGTGPEAAGCLRPGGLSPEQPGADVRILHRVELLLRGHRPHLAGLWGEGSRGPHASASPEARLQAPLMVAAGEPQGTGRRTPGALAPTLAANATGGRALSPDPHTEGGEGGAGCSRNAPQLW